MIEIEKKFPVQDFDKIRTELASGEFDVMESDKSKLQSDEYYNHRQLRFELQDIALRIREVDDKNILTFKGPNLDATTKIRSEIEIDLDSENRSKMNEIFLGLGMHSVAKVTKAREAISLRWQGASVEVCLDAVEEVGKFVELEIVAKTQADVPAAKEKLEALAEKFGLQGSTTTSYLEMLLKARGQL